MRELVKSQIGPVKFVGFGRYRLGLDNLIFNHAIYARLPSIIVLVYSFFTSYFPRCQLLSRAINFNNPINKDVNYYDHREILAK